MNYNPIQTNSMPINSKLKNMLWRIINVTIFRLTPSKFSLFRKFRVMLLKIFGAHIDWNVSIHPFANIDYPWNLEMRNRSSLGEKCWVYAMDHIFIDEFTCIGKDVYLLTGSHDIESSNFKLITKPITIGKGCWIATAAIILTGIEIGNYCVVAASSVVCKNVINYSVMGGNPAKFIKERIIKE